MRRYLLITLSTMAGLLAVASPASADRVFTVDGAKDVTAQFEPTTQPVDPVS